MFAFRNRGNASVSGLFLNDGMETISRKSCFLVSDQMCSQAVHKFVSNSKFVKLFIRSHIRAIVVEAFRLDAFTDDDDGVSPDDLLAAERLKNLLRSFQVRHIGIWVIKPIISLLCLFALSMLFTFWSTCLQFVNRTVLQAAGDVFQECVAQLNAEQTETLQKILQ